MKICKPWIQFIIISVITLIGMTNISMSVHADDNPTNGVLLDMARTTYSINDLKTDILHMQAKSLTFLTLHATDDQSFAFFNPVLKQTTGKIDPNTQLTINARNHQLFLSRAQLIDLIDFAQLHHVKLQLEMDVPAHSQALVKQLKAIKYPHIKSMISQNELDYANPQVIKLIQRLLTPYLEILPKNSVISIGTDEFSGGAKSDRIAMRKFINSINQFVQKSHHQLQVYNDGIFKDQLNDYDKSLRVVYWSQSGDTNNQSDQQYNLTHRASFGQIQNAGLTVINADANSLYADLDANQLRSATETDTISRPMNNMSNQLSIWSEHQIDPALSQPIVLQYIDQF